MKELIFFVKKRQILSVLVWLLAFYFGLTSFNRYIQLKQRVLIPIFTEFELLNLFIGEKNFLLAISDVFLAKILFYWRQGTVYWRKSIFIGDLEILFVFSNSQPQADTSPCRMAEIIHE